MIAYYFNATKQKINKRNRRDNFIVHMHDCIVFEQAINNAFLLYHDCFYSIHFISY